MGKREMHIVIRAAVVILAGVSSYIILKWTFLYLYPFIAALVIAAFIQPAVTFLETKTPLPRVVAAAAVVFTGMLCSLGGIVFVTAEIFQGTTYLAKKLPEHVSAFAGFIQDAVKIYVIPVYDKILSLFNGLNPTQKDALLEQFDHVLNQASGAGSSLLQDILLRIPSLLSIFPLSITIVFFIVLAVFFITNDWDSITSIWGAIVPARLKSPGLRIWHSFIKTLTGWFKAQIILMLLSTSVIYIGFLLLQIEQALTIALLIALVDMIPLIGTGIVFIPWILYLFMSGEFTMTIGLSILYMVVVIGRQFAEPKLLSSHIGVNPLVALIGLFVGIRLFGVWGLFLTPFLLIVFSTFLKTGVFTAIWKFILNEDYHFR